jgi:hypothetical protein
MPFASQESSIPLKDPKACGALDNIEGGEPNLLPASALDKALRVEFPLWNNSGPSETEPEYAELFWNGVSVERKEFKVDPVPPSDLFIDVPVSYLSEGEHALIYKVFTYNGSEGESLPYKVTVDKAAPVLEPGAQSKLIFPSEVLPPNKLTAHYLEGEDLLSVEIPAYTAPRPGDLITWYWDQSSSGTTIGGSRQLTAQDYDKPLILTILGQWIRDSGDGDRHVWYTVTDRAGNSNGQSVVETLNVAAQPIPRVLPPPKVVEAGQNDWPVRGTLNPIDAVNGVTIVLNPASVIYPDEVPQVQWAQEGTLGAYLADPITPGAQEYKIPKEYMAPHFGKVIPVIYLFKDKLGKEHQSVPYLLTVSNYPNDRLPSAQFAQGSPLSLAQIPPTGASITLTKWPFSAAGQRITIMVEGIEEASGKTIKYVVLEGQVITPAQAITGIAKGEALVPKAEFLSRIRMGSTLFVKVYVSFDNSQTPPNPAVAQFPWAKPKLIA